ncbi:hypothetical protein Vretimale_8253 [Volvox reticuliferus]|uniref:Uncharacterized protein n=1 Tax=Volvox reticuliferus TaxID=1737510 RepID=A0A8J4GAY1_9CHLO|nr:hypothetical protein Vretifemale_11577 [Volvox reticuliferus]GIM03484.1 hypothetical protein Vretimale_8253 [Volvox reticuliferus]
MEPDLEAVASTSYEGTADTLGRWNGRGHVAFKSGATYDGNWSAGQMHGHGKITFPDGICYEGEFQNNKLTGKGVYTWPSGACYEGHVVNGRREGRGRLSFTKSPAVYDGQWHNGLRHGHGVLYTNTVRTSYYRGNWVNDTKNGSGVMKYDNGDVYDGMWENDKKKGLGTMRWLKMRQQYSGEWDNNVPNGAGLHVWFGDGEMGVPAHAQLLMHNRYYGHFKDGRRHGYGVLYYATGARYEGYWLGDQKHGPGCFVFENGEVWAGVFAQDRPLLAPGDTFSPSNTGMVMQIDDLCEEEENPAVSRRAVSNLLLCYNTELRSLYDKYCKRPSYHLPGKLPRLSFSLRTAQLWELLNDCRLLSPQLTHNAIDDILATARLAPERLRHFRQQEAPNALVSLPPEQRRFWDYLFNEHMPGGVHSPQADMTFRAFCEAIVRIAAMRFNHLPSLERRLHVALTQHLLHLVNKAKAAPPAPPAPLPILPPNTSIDAAGAALAAAHDRLATVFLEAAGAPPPPSKAEVAAALASPEARGGAATIAGVIADPVYGVTAPARSLAAALMKAASSGTLMHPLPMKQALLQLLWNYITRNLYGPVQRMTMEPSEDGSGYRTVVLSPEDEQEVMFAMDTPLTFAEWQDGVMRIVCDWADPQAQLPDRLAAVLSDGRRPAAAEPPAEDHDGLGYLSIAGTSFSGNGRELSLGGALSAVGTAEAGASGEVRSGEVGEGLTSGEVRSLGEVRNSGEGLPRNVSGGGLGSGDVMFDGS